VVAEHGRVGLVLVVAEHLGQMLDEIAAEGDVDDLAAPADGEHGHVARAGRPRERELGAVALGPHLDDLRMRRLVVALRVEVRAAGEDERVERVERLRDRHLGRRHDHRPAAGALDPTDVGHRHDRRLRPPERTPARDLGVGGDPDDRSHASESTNGADRTSGT